MAAKASGLPGALARVANFGKPFGRRLIWEDYDIASEQLIYRGDRSVCPTCPLAGTCPKQFEYNADRHETFWAMVPIHSQLALRGQETRKALIRDIRNPELWD